MEKGLLRSFNESTKDLTGFTVLQLTLGGLLIYAGFEIASSVAETQGKVAALMSA